MKRCLSVGKFLDSNSVINMHGIKSDVKSARGYVVIIPWNRLKNSEM
jgi:hypothetical protein